MHQLERKILDDLSNGDEKAFEILFKSYFEQLRRYSFEILKDHDAAEEIAEEIFVNLWENRDNLFIDTSVRGYLFRSAYNRCINYLKHLKVEDKYRLFFIHHISPQAYNSEYQFDYPLSAVINKELEHLLERSIEKLPHQCREIFMMSRFEDMQNKKIAERLGLSVSTVKTQISRAIVKIKKDLQEALLFF